MDKKKAKLPGDLDDATGTAHTQMTVDSWQVRDKLLIKQAPPNISTWSIRKRAGRETQLIQYCCDDMGFAIAHARFVRCITPSSNHRKMQKSKLCLHCKLLHCGHLLTDARDGGQNVVLFSNSEGHFWQPICADFCDAAERRICTLLHVKSKLQSLGLPMPKR